MKTIKIGILNPSKIKDWTPPALILLIAIMTLLSGCKKELNLVAEDEVTDATFWKTSHDFELAANDLYNGLDRFGFEDTESDIAFNNPNSVSNGSYQTSETSAQWNTSYFYIRSANVIFEKADTTSNPQILRYKAEAQFFRAWYYWKLYRIYGGVPLIDQVYGTGDPGLFTPRSTMAETADFILKDLLAASTHLPKQSALEKEDIGRITRGAALSLAARVALFEGTWEKFRGKPDASKYLALAADYAAEVIDNKSYGLFTGKGDQSYRYLFLEPGDDSRECILDRRYERNIIGHDMPYQYDGVGYNPTKKLADMYLDKNGVPIGNDHSVFKGYNHFTSEFEDRDPRMTMTMIIPGTLTNRVFFPETKVANWPDFPQRSPSTGYILYKYMSEDPIANNSGQMGDNSLFDYDKHLIRYAEVLLIYAEATFEKNGQITDAELNKSINLLRDRARMPHLSNAFVTANHLDMRTEIRRERTVELALEGFRYDDLRRWKTAETAMKADVKGIKIKGSDWQNRPPYSKPDYQNKADANGFMIVETKRLFDPNKDYLQPLPTKEIAFYSTNGYTLKQNPGW